MEEEYELISKTELQKLRSENEQLKQKLKHFEPKIKMFEMKNQFNEISSDSKEEEKKEKEILEQKLNKDISEIRDFSKQILDNILLKTEGLDNRLNEVINITIQLTETIRKSFDELPKEKSIKELIELTDKNKNFNKKDLNTKKEMDIEKIYKQLKDIEVFMSNLRVLLSYVKPNDFRISKN